MPTSSSPPSPPSIRHSVSSSDPKFSTKSLMFPDTPHATILSSKPPSSSNNIVAKHNNRTRRRSTSEVRNSSSSNNHHHHHNHPSSYDLIDEPWVSPYYKGLTDQSLAINNNNNEESLSQNQSSLISNSPSSGSSPYYKGLTDFSLVLHAVAAAAPHGGDLNEAAAAEGGHECSPYYRGLTDFSLAIGKHEGEGGSYRYSIGSSVLGTCNFNYLGLCLGWNEEIIGFNQPPHTTTTTVSNTPKGNRTELNNVEMEVEEKRLGETVILSELENKREKEDNNNNENEKEKMMMKPLRESVTNTNTDHKQTVFAISESSDHHDQCSGKDVDVADIDVITEKMKVIAEEEEEEESVKEYEWANKYQPKALAHFICHKNIVAQLQEMIKEGCACNHFIFEGPPGVGKRSMIRALLREVFGQEGVEVTEEYKTFNLKGEMVGSIQVRIKKSDHHVEVNLSETKGYEQHVIVDLFRETYEKVTPNSFPCVPDNCQAIVIYEAEKLSTESLLYIKWMLERHKGCNKVFFCCSDESKLQIVKPLCSTLRLSSPSSQEIVEVLEYIGKEEGKEVTTGFLTKVVEKSKNNLRQAIRSLEATCHNKDSIKEDELILTGWEDDISNIAKKIIKQQSPKQLYIIHLRLQSLMIHNVSPYFVYKYLVSELNSLVDDSLRPEVAKLDKEYNNNVYEIKLKNVKQSGHAQNKEGESDEKNNELPKKNAHSYLKIEEFIAKFMSWYKNINASSSRGAQNDLGA